MKKKLVTLLIIFSIIIAGSVLTCNIAGNDKDINNSSITNIVTSFYPMYIITLNITDGAKDVSVTNLTPNQTGCLHDYQFTTSDMRTLEDANVFIINGGGMETFIMDVANQYPQLDIIDTSCGTSMLHSDGEGHAHTDENHIHESDEDEHNHDHDEEYNSHMWLNTHNYMIQIQNACDELCKLDEKNSDIYRSNTKKYLKKIDKIDKELNDIKVSKHDGVIIFHEAFAYLADEIGLNVMSSIEIDGENSSLSSGEIASIIDEIKDDGIKYIFTEKQFKASIADRIAAETDAQVYVFDSLVTGDNNKDAYINGMENNIKILKKLFEKQ